MMNRLIKRYFVTCAAGMMAVTALHADEKKGAATQKSEKGEWIQLFNGKDLTNWTPKFKGLDLGVNYKNTFLVKDGLLTVSYDNYEKWDRNFGHLFFKGEFSHYILRVEYRFIGDQVQGAPAWAFRNNGLMIHGQSAASMEKGQEFPDSIEVQLLGGHPNGKGERSTLNLCTPGTHVYYKGKLEKNHCISSNSQTFHGDQWVSVEIEVHGGKVIRHKVGGKVVLEYKMPQLNDGTILEGGTISIQAESHPTQFRKIELKELKK